MEVHTIPLDFSGDTGKYLIYRPLAGLAFVGNRAMADLAIRASSNAWTPDQELPPNNGALEFMARAGYFQPDPQETINQPAGYSSLVLLLTNRCQLRCTYCYAAAGEQPREALSEAHAQAAMDYFFEQALANDSKEVHLIFHGGGEPTTAWTLIQKITSAMRAGPIPAKVSLTTNAMWTRRQMEWICSNMDSVAISMDGAPETQNRQRPMASGKISSPVVMRNLAEMDRRGTRYGIRITSAAPFETLPENVEFICKETGTCSLQVEPAFNSIRGRHQSPHDTQWFEFAEAFSEAFLVARSHGRRLYYSGARTGIMTNRFCTSPYNALVVAPGGRVVACYEITNAAHPLAPVATFGSITGRKVRIDQAARKRLHTMLDERRATCRDCFCYWTCAGDCFTRAFEPGPQGHLAKTQRCDMNRTITARILLALISEGSGYWSAQEERAASEQPSDLEEQQYG